MKKLKLICAAIFISFLFACNSNENKKEEIIHQEAAPDTISTANSGDSTKTIINRSMIWSVEPQNSENDKLKAPQNVQLDTFSSSHLIELINHNFPDIQLDLVKVSHDTIYVKIPDSKRLTQEIGNTGAENYLAATTYTLTELRNIKFVNIAMKAGDHAEPGVYSREDFKALR